MTLADWLNDELNRRQWSQSDLAREAGLKRQTVNYIVSGQSKSPDSETMRKLARALNLPVEELYRAGGLLPPVSERDAWTQRIIEASKDIHDPDDQRVIEDMFKTFREKNQRTKKRRPNLASGEV